MLDKEEKEVIAKKIRTFKEEVANLRKDLNSINALKENSFKKQRELKNNLIGSINKIKTLKSSSDSFSSKVEDLRKERDNHNSVVRGLISKIKELDKQREEILIKNNIKIPPNRLKEDIERLEKSIETEGYSFDKELKVMKKIKELKTLYKKTSVLNEVFENMDNISKSINENRLVADDCHKKMVGIMSENKKSFDGFLGLSKEIESLKKQQALAFEDFKKHKSSFNEKNNSLKEKLLDLSVLQSKLNEDYNELNTSKKEKQERIMEERVKSVEEKISKKQKLTTEDLIFFQGSNS